jgi:membrane fusion protein, multidrug efflux system
MTPKDRMNGRWIASAAPLALVGLLAACGGDARADGSEREDPFERVINVEVLVLEVSGFTELIRLTGTVRANLDVTVSAEESGVIREILAEKGSRVSEGQPLVRIDDRILRSQAREAEARAALARETWERRKRLFEEDGVGSELAYLEARYQAEQADAAWDALRERLDRTVIRSPIDGILEGREVEVGVSVSPGMPVARVVQVNPVKISSGVPERYAGEVSRGSSARVTFDALRDRDLRGSVSYVGATVNPRNRTFEAEVIVPNPGGTVKPEMVANVEITRRELSGVIVIPQDAVVRTEEGFVAFVVEEEDGREVARVRPLSIMASQRNRVVVETGLAEGDRLIVVGQQQVAAGDRVQVVRTRDAALPGGDR